MNTTKLAVRYALAAAVIAAGASAATAMPLAGAELRSHIVGAEMRGSFRGQRGNEHHVWRFATDGSVAATYIKEFDETREGIREEGRDSGAWSLTADTLCLQFRVLAAGQRHCYTVDMAPGGQHVRLVSTTGGPIIVGTLSAR